MNTALWTVQVFWGVFFSLTGFGKVCCYKPALLNQALQDVPLRKEVANTCLCSMEEGASPS